MSWADRLIPLEERIARKIRVNGECREWTGAKTGRKEKDKRPIIGDGKGGCQSVCRLVWTLAHGPIPDGFNVLHTCDNPLCLRTGHFFLGTQSDNMRDMYAKNRGNRPRGENHPSSKISNAEAETIRSLRFQANLGVRVLARMYGVTPPAIRYILRNPREQKIVPELQSPENCAIAGS